MAAWLAAGSGAVVSHESALDLLGLTDVIPDRINLTVARSTRGRRPPRGLAIHTSEQPPDGPEIVIRDGIHITGAARTITDMARAGLAPDQLSIAIKQAIGRGLATRDQILSVANKQGTRVSKLVGSLMDRIVE
jgi:predicted transcriptional regulator of viral defense system